MSDIYEDSGNRLPLVARADLDETRQQLFDEISALEGSIAGLRGPAGLHLYSPAAPELTAVNRYLRFKSGIDAKLREVTILTTAREHSQQFEWAMHEPMALKAGVDQGVIDIIKYRKPVDGIPENFAIMIRFGRALLGDRKVPPELFAQARAVFGDRGLIDLVLLIENYTATAVLLTAFDMQLPQNEPALLPDL